MGAYNLQCCRCLQAPFFFLFFIFYFSSRCFFLQIFFQQAFRPFFSDFFFLGAGMRLFFLEDMPIFRDAH